MPPRVLPIDRVDRAQGTIGLHVGASRPGLRWLAGRRPGDRAILSEALGRGFEIEPRSRHLLLVGNSGAMPWLRALVDDALATGRQVVVLTAAPGATSVYPSSLLPDEVEYVIATEDGSLGHGGPVEELAARYEAWADQCFASGPRALLASLVRLAGGRDARLGVARLGRKGRGRTIPAGTAAARRRAWLQVLPEHDMGCALGVCLGCVVEGTAGPQRVCRDGPAFAADELTWPEGP